MMRGFITVCYSDWTKERFNRGVMRIIDGEGANYPIRRILRPDEEEGRDYYVKTDPDFSELVYSCCHRKLRQQLRPGDILFFRTLWRKKQYFIGYFLIKEKMGDPEDPICIADENGSFLVPDFKIEITPKIVKRLNPRFNFDNSRHPNSQINENLGRNYLCLDHEKTFYLISLIQKSICNPDRLYYKVLRRDLRSGLLLGAPAVQYKIGEWVYPLEPFSPHRLKGGGLWALKRRSDAFAGQRYQMKRYQRPTRIFSCQIGIQLYDTSYRIKTDKVKLIEEIV